MLETHACAIPGCRVACPTSHLMCILHWRMVPAPLGRDLNEAFRAWRSGRSRRSADVMELIKRLRKAQDQAVAAVVEKEVKRDLAKKEGQGGLFFSP